MNTKRAAKIFKVLVEGVDPATGQEITGCAVLERPETLRALLAGIEALNEKAARDDRQASRPPNARRRWTADEERRLVTQFQAGDALGDIAQLMGRTLVGIESRLERLGLLTPDQRITKAPFGSDT